MMARPISELDLQTRGMDGIWEGIFAVSCHKDHVHGS